MPIQVKGLAQVATALEQFPARVQRNALRRGLRAGAKVIAEEAKALAPRETGQLAKAIIVDTTVLQGVPTARVRLKGKHAFLAHFFEWGVAPHLISVRESEKPTRTKRSGKVEAWSMKFINTRVHEGSLKIGTQFVGPVVYHPGMAPHPFMRPALDAKAEEAVQAFAQTLGDWIGQQMPEWTDSVETENTDG